MFISEITQKELQGLKKIWKDEEFKKTYHSQAIRGDISNALPDFQKMDPVEREKLWNTKIWNSLSKKDRENIIRHSMDRYGEHNIYKSLKKAIKLSEPLTNDVVSYRGVSLVDTRVESLISRIDAGKFPILTTKHPTSYTNDMNAAWKFAKGRSYLIRPREPVPVLLEIKIPKGTQIARISTHHGIGLEHVVDGPSRIKLLSVTPYRKGFKFTGKLL